MVDSPSHPHVDTAGPFPTSFRQLFDDCGVHGRLGWCRPPIDDYLARIRAVKDHHRDQHRDCLERSSRALSQTRAVLQRQPVLRVPESIPAPVARSTPVHDDVRALSKGQWMLFFATEMASLAPTLSESKTFRMATRLHEIAPHVRPEFAAITLAAGLSLTSAH